MRFASLRMMLRLSYGAAGAAALFTLSGCAPESQYRYTAMIPAVRPIAWDGRTPKAGSLGVEGTLSHTDIATNYFPVLHDTAVWVPEWTADGTALIAVGSKVQLGLRGSYASYEWTRASAVGTMPVPNAPSTWGLGPEIRAAFPLDPEKHWAIGIAGHFLSYQVPYAEWTLNGTASNPPVCTDPPACASNYSLHDTRTESHWVYNLGIYPSYAVGDRGQYGTVVALLGATNGFKNDGFTNTASNGSTIDSVGPIFLLGVGYGFRYDVMHAMALVNKPVTDGGSPVNYNFGFQVALGVDFDISANDDERRPPPGPPPAARED